MLRIPHCLDNRLTVNCEIVATCSSTYSPVRTSQKAHFVSIKYSYARNRPWWLIGLWDVEAPTLSRQSARTGRALLPRNINFLLLALISVRGWVNCRQYRGVDVYIQVFSVLIECMWCSYTPRALYRRRKSPGTHQIWGWVGPRVDVDVYWRKILPFSGTRNLIPRPSHV
jgi:hypothetical protein